MARAGYARFLETEIDAGTRAKRIKAGIWSGRWQAGRLTDWDCSGYDTFHGNGLRFQWRDEDGEVEGYVSWKDIEKELGVLILTGEYQPETPRIDELAMDGLREDDESLMPNTGKWNRRRQNQRLMIMQYRMSRRAMLLTEIM